MIPWPLCVPAGPDVVKERPGRELGSLRSAALVLIRLAFLDASVLQHDALAFCTKYSLRMAQLVQHFPIQLRAAFYNWRG